MTAYPAHNHCCAGAAGAAAAGGAVVTAGPVGREAGLGVRAGPVDRHAGTAVRWPTVQCTAVLDCRTAVSYCAALSPLDQDATLPTAPLVMLPMACHRRPGVFDTPRDTTRLPCRAPCQTHTCASACSSFMSSPTTANARQQPGAHCAPAVMPQPSSSLRNSCFCDTWTHFKPSSRLSCALAGAIGPEELEASWLRPYVAPSLRAPPEPLAQAPLQATAQPAAGATPPDADEAAAERAAQAVRRPGLGRWGWVGQTCACGFRSASHERLSATTPACCPRRASIPLRPAMLLGKHM
jgi:hypothetical protein